MRKSGLGLALLAVTVVIALPETATAKYWTKCGDQPQIGAGWFDAKAHGVNCPTARKVAHKWVYKGEQNPGPGRWECKFDSRGDEIGIVNCLRDPREIIKFKVGA
jgi:hypothetical protein